MREVGYDEIREQKSFLCVLNIDSYDIVEEENTEMTDEIRQPKSLFVDYPVDEPNEIRLTALTAQAAPKSTSRHRDFDWIFGVILPLICFAFDPVVFNSTGHRGGILSNYTIFAYILSIVSIMSMVAWLLWGERLGWLTPIIGGLFMTGSLVSMAVGIVIFPLSLIASIALIGLLGFTPLFTAFVYYKNAFRALTSRESAGDSALSRRVFVLSAILCFVIPFVINFQFVDPSLWLSVKNLLL